MLKRRLLFTILVALMSVMGVVAQSVSWQFYVIFNSKTKTIDYGVSSSATELLGNDHTPRLLQGSTVVKEWPNQSGINCQVSVSDVPEGTYTFEIPNGMVNAMIMETHTRIPSSSHSETVKICFQDARNFNEDGICNLCGNYQEPQMDANGYYLLGNFGNLQCYAAKYSNQNAQLSNDVDLTDKSWNPFAINGITFDGNGHSISGITVEKATSDNIGFFSTVNKSIVKNLTIKNSSFTGKSNVGGIAGSCTSTTFTGCLNMAAVSGQTNVGGICGTVNSASSFVSCLNTGNVTASAGTSYGITEGQSADLLYCASLSGKATKISSDNQNNVSYTITNNQLTNGEVALLLNGGVTDGTQPWYQKIGTDQMPHHHSTDNNTVYGGYSHKETTVRSLSNSPTTSLHKVPYNAKAVLGERGYHGSDMVYNKCEICNKVCIHEQYTNGVCNACGFKCPHVAPNYVDGFAHSCSICNAKVSMYEPAIKADDGFYEVSNSGQLFWIVDEIGRNRYLKVRLTEDIVVNENVLNTDGTLRINPSDVAHPWNAIDYFGGIFDGGGHSVSGLYGSSSMFNHVRDAEILNLGIVDSYFIGSSSSSSIALDFDESTCKNCYSMATVTNDGSFDDDLFGHSALFRSTQYSTISGCYYFGKLKGKGLCYLSEGTKYSNIYSNVSGIFVENLDDKETNPKNSKINCYQVTAEHFASGEVAYKLNNGKTDGTGFWYQQIGKDLSPRLISTGSNTVYKHRVCSGNDAYCNAATLDAGKHKFSEETDLCIFCQEATPAPQAADGYYELSSVGHLIWFKNQVTHNSNLNARLMKDIVVNADINNPDVNWSNSITTYSGHFDGHGYAISGLTDYNLFSYLNGATVTRLGIVDSWMEDSKAALATTLRNNATIQDCYIRNVVGDRETTTPLAMVNEINTNGGKVINCYADNGSHSVIVNQIASNTSNQIVNCYVMEGADSKIAADGKTLPINGGGTFTVAQLTSGEVAYRLNDGVTDGSQVWYQDVENDNIPVQINNGCNTVLRCANCKTLAPTYENYVEGATIYVNYEETQEYNHVYVLDTSRYYHFMCKYCGKTLPRTSRHYAGRVSSVLPKTVNGVTYTLYDNYTYAPMNGNYQTTGPLRRVYGKCCTATINGPEGHFIISSTFTFNNENKDIPVVAIGYSADESSHQITSLTLPKSVSVIENESYLYRNGAGIKDIYVKWTSEKEVAETDFADGFLESGTHYLHIPEGSEAFLRNSKWVKLYNFRLVIDDLAKYKALLHAEVDAQMAEMYEGESPRPAVVEYADNIHTHIDQLNDYTMAVSSVYPLLDNLFAIYRQDQQRIVEDAKLGIDIDFMNNLIDPYLLRMASSTEVTDIRATRDEALALITEFLDIYSKGIANSQPTGDGVRLRVKMGGLTPREIKVSDVKKIEFYRATE